MTALTYVPLLAGLTALVWLVRSIRKDERVATDLVARRPSSPEALPEANQVEWTDPEAAKTLYLGLRADFAEHLRFSADQVSLLQAQVITADRRLRHMERELKYLRAEVSEAEDRLDARARQAESVAEAAVQRFAV